MSAAAAILRKALLRAANSQGPGRLVRRHGMRLGVSRWVAGETLAEVDEVLRRINAQGLGAATALFDASVSGQAEAQAQVREYQAAIRHIAAAGLDAYVGIKLSHLGLGFDDRDAAFENTAAIVRDAAANGQFVRIEMEQSRHVEDTLAVYRRLRQRGLDNCGLVLQSYRRRSEADLDRLRPLTPNVRLVKGAYLEPANVAYPDKRDTDAAYMRMLETALRSSSFTAIATHDDTLIAYAIRLACDLQIPPERFAFEMLYGVRERAQRELAHRGYRVIVAAPYGPGWIPYLTRRLAERPANLAFFLRNAIRGSPARCLSCTATCASRGGGCRSGPRKLASPALVASGSEAAGGLLEQLGGAAVGQPGPAGDRAQVGGGHRADGFAAGEEYRPAAAARPSRVRSRMRSRGFCRDGANAVRMCRLTSRMCPRSDAPHARGRADWRTGPAIWADPQGVLAAL